MKANRCLVLPTALILVACEGSREPADSITLLPPRGETREIDFTTDEATWISIDVAPSGDWLVFDLLGHLYRLPMDGGGAELLTGRSENAINFHPAVSPDGTQIAFVSDRSGQNNVWIMSARGGRARPVYPDKETRFAEPVWSPDGKRLVAVRAFRTPGRGWHRQTTALWELPLDGGEPRELLAGRLEHYQAPAFSPDGRHLYFHVSYSVGEGMGLLTAGHRIQRLDLETGRIENVREPARPAAPEPEYLERLRQAGYARAVPEDPPAELTPVVSPDGRHVAFALELEGETFTYRGHEFGPRTALYLRDLETGAERLAVDTVNKELTRVNAQYEYRVFPGYSWTPDSRYLVLGRKGRIQRVEVETGEVVTIPFTAQVRRIISEQPRSAPVIGDSLLRVRAPQWPAASPDARRLAFVAVGRLWVMDLPAGRPEPLTEDMGTARQLTPSWSPDGRVIAFATWDDHGRGHVWKVPAHGGAPVRLTSEPGEYLYPTWSPDGSWLAATRGPGPRDATEWNGWDNPRGWFAVLIPAAGGAVSELVQVAGPQRTYFGSDGRLYFTHRKDPAAEPLLRLPFPPDSVLEATAPTVRSVAPNGTDLRDHLQFPPRMNGNEPVLSPDGRWIAFRSDGSIYVMPTPPPGGDVVSARPGEGVPQVETTPHEYVPGRIRVGDRGGMHHSWRDSTTLQFFSADRYVTFDVQTRRMQAVPIGLTVPRNLARGTIALTNARIITLEEDTVIERGSVVVTGARIACVGTCETTGADRVIDLAERIVMPGLVDVHAHHTREPTGVIPRYRSSFLLDLAYGVTTIIDPATVSESAFPLAEMVEAGLVMGPRTFSTGETVNVHSYGWGDQLEIRTLADARVHVGRRADLGAVSIKNFRQTRREQQQLLIEAAREHGITVTGEGGPLFFNVAATIDGQTGWEHILAHLPLYSDATTFFGKAGIVYPPTVIVAGHVDGAKEYFRPRAGLEDDEKYLRFMSRSELGRRSRDDRLVEKKAVSFPIVAEGLADIIRAGGRGAIGEHNEQPGIGSHWEIWAYAEALTPLEALRVATGGGYFVGLQEQIGTVREGKVADLIVLNSDPLTDIRNTADLRYVMKDGRLYDADTLDEIWPEPRRFGPGPWRR